MPAARQKPIDWAGIKADFLSGSMSNREIAAWYGVSEGGVRKRAKAEIWVRSGTQDAPRVPVEELIAPHVPVSIAAASSAAAATDTATLVDQGRELAERLLGELGTVVAHRGELEEAIEAFTLSDKDGGRRRAAMLKAGARPPNAGVLKASAAALTTPGEVKHGATAGDAEAAADAAIAQADDDGMGALLQ